jgi:hypothetical protein
MTVERPNDAAAVGVVCPCCELPCDKLVIDAPGTPEEYEMCERCQRCTEIIAADPHFLTDPRYKHPDGVMADLSESTRDFIRRMHEVLL